MAVFYIVRELLEGYIVINKVLLFLIVIVLNGCTYRDLYESFQADESSCIELPSGQRESCKKQIDDQMTYDKYIKERNKL